jgi:hypothetical protein
MTETKYQRYAELKKTIAAMTDELKVLENDIFGEVLAMDGEKLETGYATFTVMYRPKWKYSKKLQDQEALTKLRLKQLKAEEERTGVAEKISDGGFLRCQVKG